MPIDETLPQRPINPYGESKLIFEKILRWYDEIHGLKFVALRYFNAAGATAKFGEDHRCETHLIPNVLKVALGQKPHVEIYGTDYETPDGTCIRDYIHILDLSRAHILALGAKESAFYNLGTGGGTSVREVIDVCREVTGKEIPVVEKPRRPGDPPRLIAASEKIKRELGWQPKFEDIRAIIESAWQLAPEIPERLRRLASAPRQSLTKRPSKRKRPRTHGPRALQNQFSLTTADSLGSLVVVVVVVPSFVVGDRLFQRHFGDHHAIAFLDVGVAHRHVGTQHRHFHGRACPDRRRWFASCSNTSPAPRSSGVRTVMTFEPGVKVVMRPVPSSELVVVLVPVAPVVVVLTPVPVVTSAPPVVTVVELACAKAVPESECTQRLRRRIIS